MLPDGVDRDENDPFDGVDTQPREPGRRLPAASPPAQLTTMLDRIQSAVNDARKAVDTVGFRGPR